MPKPKTTEGGKGRPRKAKNANKLAQEAIQRMFAPGKPIKDTNMTEEASESMNDVSETPSDMDIEDEKKRARAPRQNVPDQSQTTPDGKDTASPEQKKLRNEPALHQHNPKALFKDLKKPAGVSHIQDTMDAGYIEDNRKEAMAGTPAEASTSMENVEVKENTSTSTLTTATLNTTPTTTDEVPQEGATQASEGAHMSTGETTETIVGLPPTKPPPTEGDKAHTTTTSNAPQSNHQNDSGLSEKKSVTFEITTKPPPCPTTLSPLDWHQLQDEWLHATMRAAMGDLSLKEIPTATGYTAGVRRAGELKKIPVTPTRGFVVRYDLRIKTKDGDNPVESTRDAIVAWFTKLKEIDKHAIIYPWLESDRKSKEKCIEKTQDIPYLLSNLKKYLHKLYIRAKGGTYYPQIMVGMMESPAKIMENMSWWLQFTEQGMWVAPLQKAEDTTCLGWLLYSAD